MAGRLEGKRVVITGAAQGIGLAIAETFLAEGASLFLIDRDGDLLANEAVRLRATGGKVGYTAADITDADAIEQAVATAAREIGQPNALVNNAGINAFFEPLKLSDADWQRCFDINLKGGEMAYDLIDRLRDQGVRIVVVSGYAVLPRLAGSAAAVLQKPFNGPELLRALRCALSP